MQYETRELPDLVTPAQIKRCAKIEAALTSALAQMREAQAELFRLSTGGRVNVREARRLAAQLQSEIRAAHVAQAKSL